MRALIHAAAWLVLVAGTNTSNAEGAATSCQLINGKSMMQANCCLGVVSPDMAAYRTPSGRTSF
ncbi:hypothetical protein [Bradyrhizobium sp. USDA 4451]